MTLDVAKFTSLWNEGRSFREIAELLDIAQGTARCYAHRLGLRRRATRREMLANSARQRRDEDAPSQEDAAASEASVVISPWVRDRIDSLGIARQPEWEVPVIRR